MANEQIENPQAQSCQDECSSCRIKFFAWASFIATLLCLIMNWVGVELLFYSTDTYGGNPGTVGGVVLIPLALFILIPNILNVISVRMNPASYGVSITSICFASINVTAALLTGGIFMGIAGFTNESDGDYEKRYGAGSVILTFFDYLLFFVQVVTIAVASYETKRVPKSSKYLTTQKIIISTDPTTGQQFSHVIQERVEQNMLPPIIHDPIYNPVRRNQFGAIGSTIITTLGVIFMIVGSFVGDYSSDYGVHLFLVVILTFPIVWIYVSHLFLLISAYRTKTHHGFAVTALVFAILTLLGGVGILISFAIISDSSEPRRSYYSYPGYYNANYGNYVSGYNYSYSYGSRGEVVGYGLVSLGGALIAAGQVIVIIFSSFEIRRVPPTIKNSVVMMPQNAYPMMNMNMNMGMNMNGQMTGPMTTMVAPQPQVYYSPPQVYPYSVNAAPPAYQQQQQQQQVQIQV